MDGFLGIEITADQWRMMGAWSIGALIAALVGVALHVVIFAILRRITRRTEGETDTSIVNRCSAPAWLTLPAITALLAKPPTEPIVLIEVVRHLIVILLIVGVAWSLVALTYVLDDVVRARFSIDQRDNLRARKIHTKIRVFRKATTVIVVILASGAILMTFPSARQLGAGILASAGIAGLVIGLAAQPTLLNLFAGLQIALTETLNIDDVVIVEGEWGRIEEITSTYVVVRIWDQRRLIVPIRRFIEQPFENWTRRTADLLGTVFLHCDYTVPVDEIRAELRRICEASQKWDGKVCVVQVTDCFERTMQVRALVSAGDSGSAWELRCEAREKLIAFLQREHPGSLPRVRAEVDNANSVKSAEIRHERSSDEGGRTSGGPDAGVSG